MVLAVKNLTAKAEEVRGMQVRSVGREDPLEEGIGTHAGIPKNALNEMCSETHSNIFGKGFLLCFHPVNEVFVSMGTPAVKWLAFSFSFN